MYSITVNQILDLGVARETISKQLWTKTWKAIGKRPSRHPDGNCAVLLSSLPTDLQLRWLRHSIGAGAGQQVEDNVSTIDSHHKPDDEKLIVALARLSRKERAAWIEEASRLASLIERYKAIRPKREFDPHSNKYVYVSDVLKLCDEAACASPLILSREPHRKNPPSPHTLHRWLGKYKLEGILAFFRSASESTLREVDKRSAIITTEAAHWINANWRSFKGSRHLYKAIDKEARRHGWVIPGESWFYRAWGRIPEIVKVYIFEGQAAYVSKCAPFVPRDFSDLEALQVLCGDHSERDVTVVLEDKTLARPWLTAWQDLRTGLIWGWHLSLVPSSQAAALAYVEGVNNFGAQPLARPDAGFYSYIYTDHGRTYKSHRWDGQVIAVHESINLLEGGMGLLLKHREIGILSDLQIRHLLARKWNAREKPIERFFKIVSEWEENTFDAYCGSSPSERPDRWGTLYARHRQYLSGNRDSSPFPTLAQYREQLEEFITRYNHTAHQRWTLGGERVIPIEEYRRLYSSRYEISSKTLALLLLKPATRVIEKDGVNCFRRNWYYYHEAMSRFKGSKVEILFSDDDYRRVWVILPNNEICEACLISPTSLLNPNRSTLQAVKEAQANERKLIRDYQLLNESNMRGETTEDRVTKIKSQVGGDPLRKVFPERPPSPDSVHILTRFDHSKITLIGGVEKISISDISECALDESMFVPDETYRLKEFDDGEL